MEFIKTYESFKAMNEAKKLNVGDKGVDYNDNVVEVIAIGNFNQVAKMFKKEMKSDAKDYGYEKGPGQYYLTKNIESEEGNIGDLGIYPVKYDYSNYYGLDPVKESLITESFKSSIMRGLNNQESGTRWRAGLAKELANRYNLKLDQITDADFEVLSDPSQWFTGKYKSGDHLGFFVDDNPKFAAYLKKNKDSYGGADPRVVKNPGLLLSLVRGKVGLWHGLADNPGSAYSRYRKGSEERYGLLAKEWDLRRA